MVYLYLPEFVCLLLINCISAYELRGCLGNFIASDETRIGPCVHMFLLFAFGIYAMMRLIAVVGIEITTGALPNIVYTNHGLIFNIISGVALLLLFATIGYTACEIYRRISIASIAFSNSKVQRNVFIIQPVASLLAEFILALNIVVYFLRIMA